jgi:hypothetical protein
MLRIPCKVLKWIIQNFWNGNKLAFRKLRQFYPYLRAVLIKILKTFWTITTVLFGCLFDLKKTSQYLAKSKENVFATKLHSNVCLVMSTIGCHAYNYANAIQGIIIR